MKKKPVILGIETSCDETAASIIQENNDGSIKILSNIVSSQFDIHKEFGGVVPELAARSHAEKIDLITNSKLSKNFLILSDKTKFKKLNKNSNEYEQYEAKARLNLVNKIYRTFDENLNKQYKVEFNKRTIERVKNSF